MHTNAISLYQIRPSVCPMPVMCIMNAQVVTVFRQSSRGITLVFELYRHYRISWNGTRSEGATNICGWENFAIFDRYAVYLGNEIGPWLLIGSRR